MRVATSAAVLCALWAVAGCTNDFDGITPLGDAPGVGGAGGAPGPGGAGPAGGGPGTGGAGPTSSASATNSASSSAATGGTGPGGSGPGGAGGEGGSIVPDPNCGNGTLDPGEECDGGGPDDGDGCSSFCLLEGDPFAGCPAEVDITALPLLIRGDTSAGNDFTEAPGCFSDDAKDAIFAVTVPSSGKLVAHVETIGNWDGVMALRGNCGPGDGFCAWLDPSSATLDRTMNVGQTAHVLVTGAASGDEGEFLVTLTLE